MTHINFLGILNYKGDSDCLNLTGKKAQKKGDN